GVGGENRFVRGVGNRGGFGFGGRVGTGGGRIGLSNIGGAGGHRQRQERNPDCFFHFKCLFYAGENAPSPPETQVVYQTNHRPMPSVKIVNNFSRKCLPAPGIRAKKLESSLTK